MKNKKDITKIKVLMTLSIMAALTKEYKGVNESCVFALSGEKQRASKQQINAATQKTLRYFHGLSTKDVQGGEETILHFCTKASEMLIAKSPGSVRIRGFEAIRNAVSEQLKELTEQGVDDSQKLFQELG